MLGDFFLQRLGQALDEFALLDALPVEKREGSLLLRQFDGHFIGVVADGGHNAVYNFQGLVRIVLTLHQDQRIGHAGDAQTHPAVGGYGFPNFGQGMVVRVVINDIVQKAGRHASGLPQCLVVELAVGADEVHQIEIAQVTGRVRGQRLLAAGIGAGERIDVFDIVILAHRVPKNNPRLGAGVGIGDDLVPQLARLDRAEYFATPAQVKVRVVQYSLHELVGNQHADIGVLHFSAIGVVFDGDKVFDIGMINPQGQHQGTAAAGLGDGIGTLGEQVHKGGATRRGIHRGVDRGSLRPENRQIRADATARAVHHCRLAQAAIDAL